jgi:hypothetical protein
MNKIEAKNSFLKMFSPWWLYLARIATDKFYKNRSVGQEIPRIWLSSKI